MKKTVVLAISLSVIAFAQQTLASDLQQFNGLYKSTNCSGVTGTNLMKVSVREGMQQAKAYSVVDIERTALIQSNGVIDYSAQSVQIDTQSVGNSLPNFKRYDQLNSVNPTMIQGRTGPSHDRTLDVENGRISYSHVINTTIGLPATEKAVELKLDGGRLVVSTVENAFVGDMGGRSTECEYEQISEQTFEELQQKNAQIQEDLKAAGVNDLFMIGHTNKLAGAIRDSNSIMDFQKYLSQEYAKDQKRDAIIKAVMKKNKYDLMD